MTKPSLTAKIYLVGHGYEIDIYQGDKEVAHSCRDFGGTYRVGLIQPVAIAMLTKVFEHLEDAIEANKCTR